MVEAAADHCTIDPKEFKKLINDAEKLLFPDSKKYSKLSTLVRMFKLKASIGLSDKAFTEMLTMFGDMLPDCNELPPSFYVANKTMAALGMGHEKIHACPNDCILYRKEFQALNSCPTCNTSRWKFKKNTTKPRVGVPAKYDDERISDGQLRHPTNSPSWKLVDCKWPDFAAETRNLRLALSADGINPHSSLSSRYSCWPIIMVIYNLPPWLCFKRKFIMLSLLISGSKQAGNDFDVYLAPLIDDLKILWEVGVEVYDAYRKQQFKLRAILLWTINNLPAYANLSGSVTKGYYACPICCERTNSQRLRRVKKNIYAGHMKFLPRYHPYRRQKKAFNGEQENGNAPKPLREEKSIRSFAFLIEIIRYEKAIKIAYEKELFGEEVDFHLQKIDMGYICELKEVSLTCIVVYMSYLYDVMKVPNMHGSFLFVNPYIISAKNKSGDNANATLLARRLKDAKPSELVNSL
ncbi:hypothetical protein Vadar_005227 [Vaccinium darrowii]|uniref:Uncharacterized protein n=1 Tax=Vaccinium darrowii TaxID=229202 RepID=A0ACB7XXJ0_9ERIC|nr:hypothetical protein Vadar_005227 [Vaccinium darrowii]